MEGVRFWMVHGNTPLFADKLNQGRNGNYMMDGIVYSSLGVRLIKGRIKC
jgi:hypothetical protein